MAALATPFWQRAGAWGLVLALSLSGGIAPALAQGTDQTFYFNHRTFTFPFELPASERATIQEVILYAADEQDRTYRRVASARPAEGKFEFQANHDGWYAFVVQTRKTNNQLFPPNIDNAPPSARVFIDTKMPTVSLRDATPRQGTVAVTWNIEDAAPDVQSLRLDYRPVGAASWLPLYPSLILQGQHDWDAGTNGPVEVRLQVRDRAGNQAQASTRVTPRGGLTSAPNPPDPGRPSVIYVPSTTFKLNYTIENVGPSKVKKVEVWYTQDPRAGWTKAPDDAGPQGPYTMKVAREGRYGFTLVPYSGVDLAERPPQAGEEPRIWIEVDTTKPVVEITNLFVGKQENADRLVIWWKAEDLHLKERPIRILYRTRAEEKWTPFTDGQSLPNTGNATCQCKGLPFEFFVKVEAIDEAGNIGFHSRPETVKVDLQVPRITNVQVLPDAAGGGGGVMPHSQ